MTTEASFLQAIQESPDDLTHRLVYADWLTDRGDDARAEFVRLQCELSRRDEAWDAEYPILAARAAYLRRLHALAWGAANEERYGKDVRRLYRRGLPEVVEPRDYVKAVRSEKALLAPLTGMKGMYAGPTRVRLLARPEASGVGELELDHLAPQALGELLARPRPALRRLTLNFPTLNDGAWRRLFASPLMRQLTDLWLYDAGPAADLLLKTPRPANLRRLRLTALALSEEAVHHLLSPAWAGLSELTVDQADFAPPRLDAVEAADLSALERLDVRASPGLGGDRAVALLRNRSLTRLRTLHLVDLDCRATPLAEALGSCDLPALEHLDLSGTLQPPGTGAALARSPLAPRLKGLKCGRWSLRKADAVALFGGDFRSLRRLLLTGASLAGAPLKALLAAPWLRGLSSLDLGGTGLKGADGRALAACAALSGLRVLDLSANDGLGDRGAIPVVGSPHLAGLEALHLSYMEITDATVRALAAAPMLEGLVVLRMDVNDGLLSEDGPLLLGESGRCKSLRSVRWDVDGVEGDPEAQTKIDAAFGPGVYDFDRDDED